MYDTAIEVIGRCDACQKARAQFPDKQKIMTPTFKGQKPFQQWSIDTIPLGDVNLVVCVDTFSKWVEVLELESRSAEEVWLAFFKEVICRYGVPRVVRTD